MENQFSAQALLEEHVSAQVKAAPHLTLELIEKAIAASGFGLNHTIGERVLAVGDNSRVKELTEFFMLTDRRIAWRQGHLSYQASLGEITHVVEGRTLAIPHVKVYSPGRISEVRVGLLSRWLLAYLADLCQQPPAVRTPPSYPIPAPTSSELLDDQWVKANASILGPVCEQMMWIITARLRRGDINLDVARNFIGRIVLHSRNSLSGRGMLSGWWLSPLPITDLQLAIQQLMGPPKRVSQQPNLVAAEFSLSDGGARGKAAASSAAGLAAAAFLGVGWVSIPAKTVSQLRVSLSNAPGMTCIDLQGASSKRFEPISELQPSLLTKLLQLLGRCEQSLLYRRTLFGWEEDPAQLMGKTLDEVQERLTRLTS